MTVSMSARLSGEPEDTRFADARKRLNDRAVGRAFAVGGRIVLVWLVVYAGSAGGARTPNGFLIVSLLAAVWVVAFRSAFAAGHYTVDSTITVAIGTVTGLVLASALNEWVPGLGLTAPRLLATAVAIFGLVAVWEWLVRRAGVTRWRVLVVGSPGIADSLVDEVRRTQVPFEVVGTVGDTVESSTQGIPYLGAVADLPAIVEADLPELIVLADGPGLDDAVEQLLEIPRRRFRVVGLSSFYEWAFGRVPVPYLTPSWFMSLIHLRQRVSARWSKRTFDIVLATFALIVFAPVLVVVALLVATTRGPIVFRQTRIGERGRPFTIYKFRTMSTDAESVAGPVWASAGDPRATRIGWMLRRTHLDELPQLLNVLRGDMSIVGPRPERPEFIELLEAVVPSWRRRLLVKPGITGWAQVRSGYAADYESTAVKLSYDLWYLRHRNLVIDLAVCAKTFFIVLGLRQEPRVEPAGAASAGGARRRSLGTLGAGAALVLCLTGLGVDRPATPTPTADAKSALTPVQPPPPPPVTPPRPPAAYRVPSGALRVSTSAQLHAALARHQARRIVLAAGTYRSPRPFLNPHGHRLYAAKLGAVVLKAGLSLGGNEGRGGGLVRGVVFDVDSRSSTVDGAVVAVWGTGRNSAVLDSTLRGNRVVSAAIVARQPSGLIVRRVVVRGFSHYGVVVDANQLSPSPPFGRFWISDLDVARVSRPVPGSSEGRAEACVWIGNSGSVRRVRADQCAWTGLWTGTATRRSSFEDIDISRTRTGVYIEHYTRNSVFRRLRVRQNVRTGVVAEWADPAWSGKPASVDNIIEDSRFASWLAGVFLDAGTTRTTVRRSTFANQSWAAIGDYRGVGNAFYDNDYRRIKPGAAAIAHGHLGAAAPRRTAP
jgi:exopolysaccharide biosynthesis polyprenyl glycosylphosphotransferase